MTFRPDPKLKAQRILLSRHSERVRGCQLQHEKDEKGGQNFLS